jgi:hypothetical protein
VLAATPGAVVEPPDAASLLQEAMATKQVTTRARRRVIGAF